MGVDATVTDGVITVTLIPRQVESAIYEWACYVRVDTDKLREGENHGLRDRIAQLVASAFDEFATRHNR